METVTTEEWRDIKGYEGIYQVSSLGRVRSIDHECVSKSGRHRHCKGKMKTPTRCQRYYKVGLTDRNGNSRFWYVHILVAQAFCPRPKHSSIINHIDNDGTNNHAENLEWVTPSQNNTRGFVDKIQRFKRRKVKQIAPSGEVIAVYPSMTAASKATGVSMSTISGVCYHKTKYDTGGGWKWEFAEPPHWRKHEE